MIEDSVLALTKADVRRKQEENQGREFEKRKSVIDNPGTSIIRCDSLSILTVSNSRESLSALNAVSFAMYSFPDFRA